MSTDSYALPFDDNLRLADAIRAGIPATLLRRIPLPLGQLAVATLIPVRTLERRLSQHQNLKPDEGERAVRIIRIFERAKEVLEDEQAAMEWLTGRVESLGWRKPIDVAAIEPGALEVEQALGRIEHGTVG